MLKARDSWLCFIYKYHNGSKSCEIKGQWGQSHLIFKKEF